MGSNATVASCTKENVFSDWWTVRDRLLMTISSTAAWVGTVTTQIRYSTSGTAYDTDTFTADTVAVGIVPENGCQMRIGIKTGGYTSGKVSVRLSQ